MKKNKIICLLILIGIGLLLSFKNVNASTIQISYRTHVQNLGWQTFVKNGAMAGTSGKSLRLEGINIKTENQPYSGNVEYCTHVQNIGWQSFVKNGEMSGTTGKSLRLEAIKIRLTGELANHYDIYYRVHCQNIGWMNWAKNGESAGSAGYSLRLEAIEIVVVNKGCNPPARSNTDYNKAFKCHQISYRTHVQNIGWQNYVYDGEMAGTSGRSLRLEGINIKLENQKYSGDIEYCTHVQNIGWQGFVKNGAMSGTSGRSLRLEAIKIRLTGEMANRYDIYYRVHCQNIGWMDWAKNGEAAGTAGYSYRLEGINIVLVEKGGKAPGKTINCFQDFYNNKSEYKINYENLNKFKKSNNIDIYVYNNTSFPIIVESYTENYFLEFTSDNSNIAKCDNNGNIYANSVGKTKITMNFRNKKNKQLIETCDANINVTDEYQIDNYDLNWIKNYNYFDICVNEHLSFPSIVQAYNPDHYFKEFISDNMNIVKVDNAGNMYGIKPGKAKVTMNFRDKHNKRIIESYSANINVFSNELPKREYTLEINPTNIEVEVDKRVHVNCFFSKGNVDESRIGFKEVEGSGNCNISWKTSLKDGFDIDGKSEGKKKFEVWDYNYNEVIAVFNVIIKPRTWVSGVCLDTTSIDDAHPGFAYEIKAVVLPEGAVNKKTTWKSSNTEIAEVRRDPEDVSTGWVTVKKSGNVTITATTEEGGYSATCNITSTDIHVENIKILGATSLSNCYTGDTCKIKYQLYPNHVTNTNVIWSSTNENVAKVDSEGNVTIVGPGNAQIIVKTEDGDHAAYFSIYCIK